MDPLKRRDLDRDPFPPDAEDPAFRIPCALLHSADVGRYVRALQEVGIPLFKPFDPKGLKSASYEVPFKGTIYMWDENGLRTEKVLDETTEFDIPSNGIVFVRPDVQIQIPDFLALRFNLHIRLVHRGLLLGTGPLVDPGFRGKLLIPVHNLTDTKHTIKGSDGFIWIEVTKVSTLPRNTDSGYVIFNPEKNNIPPAGYFDRANHGNPIVSSIPSLRDEVEEGKRIFKEAGAKVKDAQQEIHNQLRSAKFEARISMVAMALGLISIAVATWAIWRDVWQYVGEVKKERSAQISQAVDQRASEWVNQISQAVDKKASERAVQTSQAIDRRASELTRRLSELEREVARLKAGASAPKAGGKASAP